MTRRMLDARLLVSANEGYQYKARVMKLAGSLIFVYGSHLITLLLSSLSLTCKPRLYPRSLPVHASDIFGSQYIKNRLLADDFAKNGYQVYIADSLEGNPIPAEIPSDQFDRLKWLEAHSMAITRTFVDKAIEGLKYCELNTAFPAEAAQKADDILGNGKYAAGYKREHFFDCTHGLEVYSDSDLLVKAGTEGTFKSTVEWFSKV
ncbi:hypothetical protein M422DRAFT_242220 [Sphaerobolus stellatus SS14]|nr:hypothetical protein M422DRAFT_242220 [Sphaerobolus stellatus SS14]